MGDLLLVDFAGKSKTYTKEPGTVSEGPIDMKAIEAEVAASLWGGGIDALAWPGMDVQAPYMAPDSDPA